MKRSATSLGVAALMTAGIVMAQTSPPPSQPSQHSTYPSSSSTTTQSSSTTTTHKSHKQQMKDCMEAQKASNPNESKEDMKKTCKSQVESNAPHQ